jgi:type I restriction enzyme R subunit
MATGSGKTVTAITEIYRLIKFGGARRVLFLVDRKNLGEQAEKEFQSYRTPDDQRKFTELYNVQRLTSDTIGSSSKVVISTIQRLYSMLSGRPLQEEEEEGSQFDAAGNEITEPMEVSYNPDVPIELFDVIFVDECHRSIYSLWRQVVEYFDAYIIGLTATPAKQTFGFFKKNLVMEYRHEDAVADGVNVDFEVYTIRTRITEQGSKIEAGPNTTVGYRDKQTRQLRWDKPDEDIVYGSEELDRRVVAPDQIRTIVRAFRDRLFTEIFPGRREVPKTLIFAKDDNHAEDIVAIVREEFGKGNEFCRKITYKTTGAKPADLIQEFRNSYHPRIAVTVDMVATGTDMKPIEIVMFMRSVKSRIFFEQMKGRGVRVIDKTALKAVTPDAEAKTHFVIVDCVGVTEAELADTQPLERKKTVAFRDLLEHVAAGGVDKDVLSSLVSRLARLDRRSTPEQTAGIVEAAGGDSLAIITHRIIEALDPDRVVAEARTRYSLPPDAEPTSQQIEESGKVLRKEAVKLLAVTPKLRQVLQDTKREQEQIIDDVSVDEILGAGLSEEAREKARETVESFERFLEDNRDEIEALQFFYSRPYGKRLSFEDIQALAQAIQAPPRQWTPEKLWQAYRTLEANRVRGASAQRLLTDIVSLVRFALHKDQELIPYRETVEKRFANWITAQEAGGRRFTPEQREWLGMMKDHIASSLAMEISDFDQVPFAQEGGLGRASQVFGKELQEIVRELNEVLAA